MPCAPGSGAGHQPAPPSHRWRWEHWVKGSVGARLEIPAEGLQAWGGGSQTEETLQSPRATGKEADFQQGLGCAAAAGGGGACGEGPSPQLCAWARGRPQAKLWSPGRVGLPAAAGASTLQASTPSYHCCAPQELFQAPGGDSTCLARQGHCPAHRTLSARLPGPASQDDSHPCRAAGHLSAGQPLKALLPQPLQ